MIKPALSASMTVASTARGRRNASSADEAGERERAHGALPFADCGGELAEREGGRTDARRARAVPFCRSRIASVGAERELHVMGRDHQRRRTFPGPEMHSRICGWRRSPLPRWARRARSVRILPRSACAVIALRRPPPDRLARRSSSCLTRPSSSATAAMSVVRPRRVRAGRRTGRGIRAR
jgi:hypothetical protein